MVVRRLRRLGKDRALRLAASSEQKVPQKREVEIGGAATAALNDLDRRRVGAASVAAAEATMLLTHRHCSLFRLKSKEFKL